MIREDARGERRGARFSAPRTVSGSTFAHGGAIEDQSATVAITNCTFIGNSASSGIDVRGGCLEESAGHTTITNSTFLQTNTSSLGTTFHVIFGNLSLTNTIVAGVPGNNCVNEMGTLSDGGHNIDDGTSCGFTGMGCSNTSGSSFCNTDPQLDPAGLATNSGPTKTDAVREWEPRRGARQRAPRSTLATKPCAPTPVGPRRWTVSINAASRGPVTRT